MKAPQQGTKDGNKRKPEACCGQRQENTGFLQEIRMALGFSQRLQKPRRSEPMPSKPRRDTQQHQHSQEEGQNKSAYIYERFKPFPPVHLFCGSYRRMYQPR